MKDSESSERVESWYRDLGARTLKLRASFPQECHWTAQRYWKQMFCSAET